VLGRGFFANPDLALVANAFREAILEKQND
jgi:hypothetical protein